MKWYFPLRSRSVFPASRLKSRWRRPNDARVAEEARPDPCFAQCSLAPLTSLGRCQPRASHLQLSWSQWTKRAHAQLLKNKVIVTVIVLASYRYSTKVKLNVNIFVGWTTSSLRNWRIGMKKVMDRFSEKRTGRSNSPKLPFTEAVIIALLEVVNVSWVFDTSPEFFWGYALTLIRSGLTRSLGRTS